MVQPAGSQIIDESTNVIVELIFRDRLVDDGLEVWRPIPWAKRKY